MPLSVQLDTHPRPYCFATRPAVVVLMRTIILFLMYYECIYGLQCLYNHAEGGPPQHFEVALGERPKHMKAVFQQRSVHEPLDHVLTQALDHHQSVVAWVSEEVADASHRIVSPNR